MPSPFPSIRFAKLSHAFRLLLLDYNAIGFTAYMMLEESH